MRSLRFGSVCFVVLTAVLQGQDKTVAPQRELEDLRALIAPIRKQHDMPALGACVIVKGKVVALGVDGVRKVGNETPVTTKDRWHLGSCTKAMTATLIAQQVAKGKLKWTTTLGEALPELTKRMHEGSRKITIEQLLRHRSGLPGQPPMAQWLELFKFEGTDREARHEVALRMLQKAPEAVPGERFLYSNAGYMIAGHALEQATGRKWQTMMREDLFAPLGMASAGFGPPGKDGRVDEPYGHLPGARKAKPMFADNPTSLGPAGTVHASLEDWAKFVALHLGAGRSDKPVLGKAELAYTKKAPKGGDYALGWVKTTRPWSDGPVIWHNGSNTMWYAVTWMAMHEQFAVLVTCNHGQGAKACDDLAAACIERFRRD